MTRTQKSIQAIGYLAAFSSARIHGKTVASSVKYAEKHWKEYLSKTEIEVLVAEENKLAAKSGEPA